MPSASESESQMEIGWMSYTVFYALIKPPTISIGETPF